MAFPSEVLERIQDGKSFLSALDAEDTANLIKGCDGCSVLNYECLSSIMYSLGLKVELDQYDEYAQALIVKMLIIIGDFTVQVPPTVDAGADQSAEIGGTVIFTAVGTAGSSPIVSYLWTQVSGTTATLTNADTASVSVSNYPIGVITLKVLVTDQNSLTDSDTAKLTGLEASLIGYWWLSDDSATPLTEAEILTKTPFNFVDAGDLTVPFSGVVYKVINIAYPATQSTKTGYVNAVNPSDDGNIGSPTDLLGAVVTTGAFKQQNGNYVINGDRTLIFS